MNEKKYRIIVKCLGIFMCLFGIFTAIYCLLDAQDEGGVAAFVPYFIEIAINTAVIVIGLVYFLKGFRKQDAFWYKLFMYAFSGSILAGIILSYFEYDPDCMISGQYWLNHVLNIVAYGNCVLLAAGKDLGKKASCILFGIVTAIYLFLCSQGEDLWDYAMLGVRSAMALVGLIMVWAKYTDKEMRNAGLKKPNI